MDSDYQHKLLAREKEFSNLKNRRLEELYSYVSSIVYDFYLTGSGIDDYLSAFDFYVQTARENGRDKAPCTLAILALEGYVIYKREAKEHGYRLSFDAAMCACAALRLLVESISAFKAGNLEALIEVCALLAGGYTLEVDETKAGHHRLTPKLEKVVSQYHSYKGNKAKNEQTNTESLQERVRIAYTLKNRETDISKGKFLEQVIHADWLHYADGSIPSKSTVKDWLRSAEQPNPPRRGRPPKGK